MVSLGTQPANRKSGFGHSSPTGARAQDLSRQPARPDLWGAGVGNDPGLPDPPPGASASRGGRENRADRCRRVRTVLCAMLFCSTYARHRIRHGIQHTAARAGRRSRPPVLTGRLRYRLIGYARGSKADGSQSLYLQRCGRRRRPRLPGLRVRRTRPTWTRPLRARAPDGRRARRLEARPPRPHPRPPELTPCRARRLSGV